ncbi:hypothetical protein OHB26_39555 (plasmid) [Nocardia sp. NBC_01503]|uniref:hypothetical protein n=1 Tax=Nocardia sp. NBC_01503 TaxID=2975997 RepID=UPI002E7B12CE|nr:hypothetical protein [Nocardia sp. NBC_01503]WTL36672.1 hypothetical protein OHB26_39020 [Nocardia sp. NBC_01503]WTL36775.1 hypothetical protein OHB26_39555 [Nocardia sp. NBC_01503]
MQNHKGPDEFEIAARIDELMARSSFGHKGASLVQANIPVERAQDVVDLVDRIDEIDDIDDATRQRLTHQDVSLSPQRRDILTLYTAGASVEEIAAVLGIPLHDARRDLLFIKDLVAHIASKNEPSAHDPRDEDTQQFWVADFQHHP